MAVATGDTYDPFMQYVDSTDADPLYCPVCSRSDGRGARASESKRTAFGGRQRRRTCQTCGDSWYVVEVRREALEVIGERLDELEHDLANAYATDLDEVLGGLRTALRALEGPYRKSKETAR